MTLWANELLAIRKQVIEVHLISLKAELEVIPGSDVLKIRIIEHKIEALEKELEIVIPLT